MRTPVIDLSDETLFGNDDAEDEPLDIFISYAVERPELVRFSDERRPLRIVRAYKGEGKSALLRLSSVHIQNARGGTSAKEEQPVPIVISVAANNLPLPITSDFAEAVRNWKAALLRRLAAEVGANIGLAFTDDAISLVEEAERDGFKSRSIISAIFDRLQISGIKIGPLVT